MKSKTSCYDCATGRMELRRFIPLWVLYAIGLFLLTGLSVTKYNSELDQILYNVRDLIPTTALYNFGYTMVLAQILFGDLYTPRLCYAIHALPIPKGGWFGTQIILGIMGTLIPNLLNFGLLFFMVPEYEVVALLWLVSSVLGFLCFFGIASLCAICAGNRLGMMLLYGLINLYDGLLAWFQMKLYAPLIYGLYIRDADAPLCPIYRMVTNQNIFDMQFNQVKVQDGANYYWKQEVNGVTANSSLLWEYVIWAVVGCAAIWLAMQLYRRRRLECAGDLLAFRKMELPVLILTTIAAGGVGHVCAYAFNWQMNYILLFLGLVLGYYACLMLLRRQVNVFRLKTLAPLLSICAVLLLSLVLTGLDILGITYRVPKAEDVASVSIRLDYSSTGIEEITNLEDIQSIIEIQEDALQAHRLLESNRPLLPRIFADDGAKTAVAGDYWADMVAMTRILYTMKDGSELNRIYFYPSDTAVAPQLRKLFSDPKVVFYNYDRSLFDENGTLDTFFSQVTEVRIGCSHEIDKDGRGGSYTILEDVDISALVDAIYADCETNNMAQPRFLHPGVNRTDTIVFSYMQPDDLYSNYFTLAVFPECENVYHWLIDHSYHGEDYADTPYEW